MATVITDTRGHDRLAAWLALQELPKHLANILPFMLGTTLAYWKTGTIDWTIALVALLAIFLLTDGTYVSNEYFDYESDKANASRIGGHAKVGVGTTGGTRVLVRGLIPRRDALVFAVICFVLAVPVGLMLRYALGTGPLTLPLGALGLFIGWFYTAPPIRACYRGLGELFIAVGQGIVVFGAYYVQAGFDWLPLIVSLPWFITLPALKILRQFPDFESDEASGKRGLTVMFGRTRMAIGYSALVIIGMMAFLPGVAYLRAPLALFVLPPAAMFTRSLKIMISGEWKRADRLETSAVSAFVAMLLIPVTLTIAFLVDALLR